MSYLELWERPSQTWTAAEVEEASESLLGPPLAELRDIADASGVALSSRDSVQSIRRLLTNRLHGRRNAVRRASL